jgi:hypothetical protein
VEEARIKETEVKCGMHHFMWIFVHVLYVGAILWDYKGKFIAASSTFIPHVASVVMAEAMVIKHGFHQYRTQI